MKRTLALVLLAAVAVWAGLIYEPARAPKPKPRATPSAQGPTQKPQGPVQRPQKAAPARVAAAPSAKSAARPATPSATQTPAAASTPGLRYWGESSNAQRSGTSAGPRAAGGETYERPQVDPSGELGEGILSPDFVELETDYVHEHREGPWALAQEQRIRQTIYDAGLAERMVLVSCQSSVCRIHFEASGPDSYAELLRAPGFARATGLTLESPYSMNTTELIVYARPPALPEPEGKP